MTMWQFMAAVEGYADAHDPKRSEHLSDADRDELWEMVKGA